MLREVPIGWGWEVYIEMFVAGIAVGAYLIAAFLEFTGRGRSPIARTAHFWTLPMVIVATLLLVYKLERSERFWHMVVQSENIPWPMFKWWAPISLGTWFLMIFSFFATISFIDAVFDRGWFKLGPWGDRFTLHGSLAGVIFMIPGALFALLVAAYSGALLSVTAVRGWVDTVFISPFFIAISGATGAAFLLLVEAFRRVSPLDEVRSLVEASTLMTVWQMILLVVLAISLGGAISFFLSNIRMTVFAIIAIVLGVAAPILLYFRLIPGDTARLGLVGAMVLASGFLLRYVVVMGPQYAILE
jgi:formate-dependent nitrite reductase membrane component NrfD